MDIEQIPLIGGHPALDFGNTAEGRRSEAPLNYLIDYQQLAQWCARVGLISTSCCAQVLQQARSHPVIAGRTWNEAMKLRECLNHIVRALATSDEPPDQAIATFNETLQQAFANRRLSLSGPGNMRWTWRQTGLAVVVWEIALAAADLMTDADNRRRIKICANDPCDWTFLDTSRGGRRRWCQMAVCGNASKVRRFRERQRSNQ